jgi:hypothetical protein
VIDRRGMVRAHSHWHPRPREPQRPALASPTVARRRLPLLRARTWAIVGAFVLVLALAVVAASFSRGGAVRPALPATPRAWLDAYEASAIDNPSRVCSELFSPQLARAYGHSAQSSCARYFASIYSRSVRVLRVWRDGSTAVLDVRQVFGRIEWNVVLDRRSGGWQAVTMFYGKPSD